MHDIFTPCLRCRRHIRASESACPFCHVSHEPSMAVRAVAAVAVSAALLVGGSHDAGAQSVPRREIPHMPAQAYGAPPFDPTEPGPGFVAPPEAPPARGPAVHLRGGDLDVQVTVSAPSPRVVARMRSMLAGSNVDLAVCRARLPQPVEGRELRVVLLGAPPRGALRDVVSHCLFRALAPLYAQAIAGERGPVPMRVQCVFSARGHVAAPPPDRCGPTPQGCRRTGCPAGLVCDTHVRCVPSACSCDPRTGRTTCTTDCGGGVCVGVGNPLGL